METMEQILARAQAAVPGARLRLLPNAAPAATPSLLVDPDHARTVAFFLRDDPALQLDYASNVTGVDWPERVEKIKTRVRKVVDGLEKEVEETTEQTIPGFLEVVYHLYSMAKKHGPVVLRQRTVDRAAPATASSLTPVWRSCELQEREVFDLFGVHFQDHPDPRRILMWDGFKDHPMRRDYVGPEDYEYEPTPHDEVLEKARRSSQSTGS